MHGKAACDQRQQAEGLRAPQTPSGHHECPGDDLRGNTWFLTISCDTICRFAVMFIKNVPHIPSLQRVFIMNGYWILSDTFYQSIDLIMQFFKIMVILIDFPVLN